jgi:hypothetical protein
MVQFSSFEDMLDETIIPKSHIFIGQISTSCFSDDGLVMDVVERVCRGSKLVINKIKN